MSTTDSASVIAQQLSGGERLVWSGQPRSGIRFRGTDAILIPFSIVWCGFAIFWEVMASTTAVVGKGGLGPIVMAFPLFGLPFVLIGLYLVFGRFIVDARLRGKTFYGVTSERIIIVTNPFGRRIKSLNLRTGYPPCPFQASPSGLESALQSRQSHLSLRISLLRRNLDARRLHWDIRRLPPGFTGRSGRNRQGR
jgi:hypothetical protein